MRTLFKPVKSAGPSVFIILNNRGLVKIEWGPFKTSIQVVCPRAGSPPPGSIPVPDKGTVLRLNYSMQDEVELAVETESGSCRIVQTEPKEWRDSGYEHIQPDALKWTGKPGLPPLSPVSGGMSLSRDALQPADIIVSTTNAWISNQIRSDTNSAVSHAMLYIGGGNVIEAIGSGVQQRSIGLALGDATLGVAYRHKNMTPGIASNMRGDSDQTSCDLSLRGAIYAIPWLSTDVPRLVSSSRFLPRVQSVPG